MAEQVGEIFYSVRAETAQAIESSKGFNKSLDGIERSSKKADASVDKFNGKLSKTAVAVRSANSDMSEQKGLLSQLGSGFKNLTSSINLAATASLAATAAITAISVIAVKAAADNRVFEKSLSDLSAITGATGDQLAYLKAQAQDIGATTSLSASQAAEAFKLIASAKPDLLESSTALNKVTRSAVTLAEAAGTTLPDAANTLGSALNQFGAGAEEADRFINVLAAGSKFGAAEVREVAESLKVSGVSAAAAKIPFEQLNAAIQSLSAVSIKGSEAGTALRNIILKLETDTNSKLRPSINGLTGALQNLASMNEGATELTKRFGLENVNAAQALLDNVDALDELEKKLTGTNTAYEQASTRTNNLDGDIKALSSAMEGLSLVIGESLNPALRATIELFTGGAAGAANFLDSLKDAPTTIGGTQLRIRSLHEEMVELEEAAKSLREEGSGLFGPSGLDKKKADEYEARARSIREELKKLQEQAAIFQGKPAAGSAQPEQKKKENEKPTSSSPSATVSKKAASEQERINKIILDATLRTKQLNEQYTALYETEGKLTSTKLRHTEASARLEAQQKLSSGASKEQIDALAKEIFAQDQMAAKLDARIERQKKLDEAKKKSIEQAKKDRELQDKFNPAAEMTNKYAEDSAKLLEARQKDLITEQTFQMQKAALATQYEQQRLAAAEELYRAQSDGNAFVMDSVNALGQASTSTISGLLSGTMSATEAMQNFANIILNQAVGALVGMGIEYIKQQILQQTLAASASAAQIGIASTTGTAVASAWAPAAAMVSLATMGTNAGPAEAALATVTGTAAGLAVAGGRQFGGPVNPGSMYRVGEGNAPELLSVGGSNYMIPGSRGQVTPLDGASGGVTFNITNNASDMVQTQQSYDPETRTVELAITAVANQINSRTGKVGAAMKSAGAYNRLG